jgi:hypothetical protein
MGDNEDVEEIYHCRVPALRGKHIKEPLASEATLTLRLHCSGNTMRAERVLSQVSVKYVARFLNLRSSPNYLRRYLLWVPPEHPLNAYRLLLYFFMSMPAIRETYQYVADPYVLR